MVEWDGDIRCMQRTRGNAFTKVFKHYAGNVGQLERARLGDRMPLQIGQLAVGNRDFVNDRTGRHAEEPRVEPSRPSGRRDGARKKCQLAQRGAEAVRIEVLPDLGLGR